MDSSVNSSPRPTSHIRTTIKTTIPKNALTSTATMAAGATKKTWSWRTALKTLNGCATVPKPMTTPTFARAQPVITSPPHSAPHQQTKIPWLASPFASMVGMARMARMAFAIVPTVGRATLAEFLPKKQRIWMISASTKVFVLKRKRTRWRPW
jgi:hypothetical protein